MTLARGIQVALTANPVASPEIRYCVGPEQMTCLIFRIDDAPDYIGRVMFEGLDAIRCCGGESMPYVDGGPRDDDAPWSWVYEIDNSAWLQERQAYGVKYYGTSLRDDCVHYFFSFHDEYVELIADGIWFERLTYEEASRLPTEHPFYDLPSTLAFEQFSVAGIECQLRMNPLSRDELIDRSRLCSQKAFQYYMTLDGKTCPADSALVRTIRGTTMTRLKGDIFCHDRSESVIEGVAEESDFRRAFEKYVTEVAVRRRQMSK